MNAVTQEILLEPEDNQRLLSLCGPFDDNIKQLERRLGVEINRRDNAFKLVGKSLPVAAGAGILSCVIYTLTLRRCAVRSRISILKKFIWRSKKAGCWNKQQKVCPTSAKRSSSKPSVAW
ncbi:PhoH family protein [Rahnella aquatilis HX2]|nr:PhoH family protein [Rahnella aquatilis HX2]